LSSPAFTEGRLSSQSAWFTENADTPAFIGVHSDVKQIGLDTRSGS
jgi:hypothetical protein